MHRGARTRLVLDLDAVAEQVGKDVGRPVRIQYIEAEFLQGCISESYRPPLSSYLIQVDRLPEENDCAVMWATVVWD